MAKNKAAIHEPPPLQEREDVPHVADMVQNDVLLFLGDKQIAGDVMDRKAEGMAKYGTPLQPFNGRDTLNDLYQELLDAANYMRQYMYEEAISGAMYGERAQVWQKRYVALLEMVESTRTALNKR